MSDLKSSLQLISPAIASGFFGDVFLAKDDIHGDVVVKVLRQYPGETEADWRARKGQLLHEGQRLHQASHANVVRVLQLLKADPDDLHLVMEYCAGGSLQKPFEAGPILLSEVRRIATDVCLGLSSLHARGMLHRDIKPGNILLSASNVAKLGDFGLVTDNLVAGYGSAAGYSDHIAIEVWKGRGTSIRSDIWALGMTIYRLLHGSHWYSQLPAPLRFKIEDGGFALSLRWLPHIPHGWRKVIRKMMNDDTSQRYQNANQVMSALSRLSCEPDWACTVLPNETRWTRCTRDRRINAVLIKHSPLKWEWEAWSEPLITGNRYSLGGSKGRISYSKAERQLREFLA